MMDNPKIEQCAIFLRKRTKLTIVKRKRRPAIIAKLTNTIEISRSLIIFIGFISVWNTNIEFLFRDNC
jgi:hypothetical protein